MVNKLDFICIGAPKSATSTLFELMEGHPQIYIPPAKEVPYFNDDAEYSKGWKWYMKTFFSDAKKGQVIGTMTPQYMSGYKANSPEVIAARIQKQLPDVKIIALLRHPIERSFSQHKMHKRYGFIDETFSESTARLLSSKNLDRERGNLTQKNMFLFASEYGRMLEKYYELFPKENILILYTDDFEKDPETELEKIFRLIGVDESYRPENIRRKSHVGSGTPKLKFLTPGYLRKFPVVEFLWRKLVPPRLRKRLFMNITRWNIKPDKGSLNRNDKTYASLVKFFESDIKKLNGVAQKKAPWADWR